MRGRVLRVGEIVHLDDRLWRVDLVNTCRARIVPLDRRHVRYETWDGRPVTFDAADHRSLSICPEAEVERVDPSTLEEIMATKKPNRTTTKKARRSTSEDSGELCTFAIRITAAERDAIHAAAGPRKGTTWARTILAAAAKKA